MKKYQNFAKQLLHWNQPEDNKKEIQVQVES